MLFSAGKPGAGVGGVLSQTELLGGQACSVMGLMESINLSCSEPSSTKIKMYEGCVCLARVYVRSGRQRQEEEKLRQEISLNYFLSIII